MRAFVTHRLGKPVFDETALISGWGELMEELERLHQLAAPLQTVKDVTRRIFRSGGVKLATLLAAPDQPKGNDLLPHTFMRDWRLRRLATHIAAIDSQAESKKLNEMRTAAESDLAHLYEDLVVRRTWFTLAERVTPSVRAARSTQSRSSVSGSSSRPRSILTSPRLFAKLRLTWSSLPAKS